jgi:hypothetical protein
MTELKDDSLTIRTAIVGCAVQVAGRIPGDTSHRLGSVLAAGEGVQKGESLRLCGWDHGENYYENGQSNESCFSGW